MTVDVHALWRDGVVALVAGVGLGLAYFAGLWWTSQRVARVAWPQGFFFASFALRIALLLGGIWLVTGGRAATTGLCLVGVLVGRRLMVEYVRRGGVFEEEGTSRPGGRGGAGSGGSKGGGSR